MFTGLLILACLAWNLEGLVLGIQPPLFQATFEIVFYVVLASAVRAEGREGLGVRAGERRNWRG